ncbi:hypothetical protein EYF80_027042 [Liparis tanakae]|uniref:Uncharacterized protein n=1 Tax=Liparis tanakae TaxID=230148 RepID=A0A4Z2HAZ9_9TELE|nr:hypothetical protein EYF80_027042 [Liparis tanakae]
MTATATDLKTNTDCRIKRRNATPYDFNEATGPLHDAILILQMNKDSCGLRTEPGGIRFSGFSSMR